MQCIICKRDGKLTHPLDCAFPYLDHSSHPACLSSGKCMVCTYTDKDVENTDFELYALRHRIRRTLIATGFEYLLFSFKGSRPYNGGMYGISAQHMDALTVLAGLAGKLDDDIILWRGITQKRECFTQMDICQTSVNPMIANTFRDAPDHLLLRITVKKGTSVILVIYLVILSIRLEFI